MKSSCLTGFLWFFFCSLHSFSFSHIKEYSAANRFLHNSFIYIYQTKAFYVCVFYVYYFQMIISSIYLTFCSGSSSQNYYWLEARAGARHTPQLFIGNPNANIGTGNDSIRKWTIINYKKRPAYAKWIVRFVNVRIANPIDNINIFFCSVVHFCMIFSTESENNQNQ